MARRSSFDILTIQTNNVSLLWKNVHGIAPDNVGTPADFLLDVDQLCEFVDMILNHLPPVEEYIECYPAGYVLNVYFE